MPRDNKLAEIERLLEHPMAIVREEVSIDREDEEVMKTWRKHQQYMASRPELEEEQRIAVEMIVAARLTKH